MYRLNIWNHLWDSVLNMASLQKDSCCLVTLPCSSTVSKFYLGLLRPRGRCPLDFSENPISQNLFKSKYQVQFRGTVLKSALFYMQTLCFIIFMFMFYYIFLTGEKQSSKPNKLILFNYLVFSLQGVPV